MGPTPKEQERDLRLLMARGQRLKQRQDEECCRECTAVHIRPYVQMQVHTVDPICPTQNTNSLTPKAHESSTHASLTEEELSLEDCITWEEQPHQVQCMT